MQADACASVDKCSTVADQPYILCVGWSIAHNVACPDAAVVGCEQEGFYNLWNWFDDKTWYPLGRVIGGTVYPVSDLPPESQNQHRLP